MITLAQQLFDRHIIPSKGDELILLPDERQKNDSNKFSLDRGYGSRNRE